MNKYETASQPTAEETIFNSADAVVQRLEWEKNERTGNESATFVPEDDQLNAARESFRSHGLKMPGAIAVKRETTFASPDPSGTEVTPGHEKVEVTLDYGAIRTTYATHRVDGEMSFDSLAKSYDTVDKRLASSADRFAQAGDAAGNMLTIQPNEIDALAESLERFKA